MMEGGAPSPPYVFIRRPCRKIEFAPPRAHFRLSRVRREAYSPDIGGKRREATDFADDADIRHVAQPEALSVQQNLDYGGVFRHSETKGKDTGRCGKP
jgi:hypothetical protein